MKKIFIKFLLIIFAINRNVRTQLNGIYIVKNILTDLYLSFWNDKLILSNKKSHFRIKLIKSNIYLIETRIKKRIIGVSKNDEIILYNNHIENKNYKTHWNLTGINNNIFIIQSQYNGKFLTIKNNRVQLVEKNFDLDEINNAINLIFIDKGFFFSFKKLFQENPYKNEYKKKIANEKIDVIMKYIDLSDKGLKRNGILQTYKDQNNEELKYSLRSIFQYTVKPSS